MWDVYWVGVFLGLGVGLGIALAGLLGAAKWGVVAAAVVAGALGVGIGLALGGVEDGGAGVVVALLALIPLVGFLEAAALPAVAVRLRRREPERYAGLRTLARD